MLGIKWLQKHDVITKWGANIVLLNSPYCKKNYLKSRHTAIVPGIVNMPDTPAYLQQGNPPLESNALTEVKKKQKRTFTRTQRSRRQKIKERGI